jgi:hypothetical protein
LDSNEALWLNHRDSAEYGSFIKVRSRQKQRVSFDFTGRFFQNQANLMECYAKRTAGTIL